MTTTQTSPEFVESTIFDAIAQLGPDRSQVTRDATLEALDVDSLDLVELAQVVEETWGVEMRPDDIKDVATAGEAVNVVLARVR